MRLATILISTTLLSLTYGITAARADDIQDMEVIKLVNKHRIRPESEGRKIDLRLYDLPEQRSQERQMASNKEYIFKDKDAANARFMNLVNQDEMTADVKRIKERSAYGL